MVDRRDETTPPATKPDPTGGQVATPYEMRAEADGFTAGPGVVMTKTQAKGATGGIVLGAIAGAIVGLIVGLIAGGGTVLIITVIAFGVAGAVAGGVSGGISRSMDSTEHGDTAAD